MIALGVTSSVMLLVSVGLAIRSGLQFGMNGVVAALIVCGVCWISGLLALATPLVFRDPKLAAQGLLLGMLFRMGPPLLLAVFLLQTRSYLLEVGALGMLVAAYLVGLVVETALSWWIAETSTGAVASGMVKAS